MLNILKNNIKAILYVIYKMTQPYRHNFKWNVNELLSLQREYELLEMTIQDIADKHERTVESILYRLCQEGFIDSWVDARGYQEYSKKFDFLVGSLDTGVDPYDYGEDVDNEKDSDYEEEEEEEEDVEDEDYENYDYIPTLSERVWGLETAVTDIKGMINTLLTRFTTSSKPLKKLRQTSSEI